MKLCNLLLQVSLASMASSERGQDGPQELHVVAGQQVFVAQNTTYSNPRRGSQVQYRYMSESQKCKDYTVFTDYNV